MTHIFAQAGVKALTQQALPGARAWPQNVAFPCFFHRGFRKMPAGAFTSVNKLLKSKRK
ncbi:MAG: hypothetical protein ACK4K8_10170 [Pannonibacter sp.]